MRRASSMPGGSGARAGACGPASAAMKTSSSLCRAPARGPEWSSARRRSCARHGLLGVALREAEPLAVVRVGRVLVLAGVDGEAGRRVVEVARERPRPPGTGSGRTGACPRPSGSRAAGPPASPPGRDRLGVDLGGGVVVVRVAGRVVGETPEGLGRVEKGQLRRLIRGNAPTAQLGAREDHGLGVVLRLDRGVRRWQRLGQRGYGEQNGGRH